jgi:hypothetical protein
VNDNQMISYPSTQHIEGSNVQIGDDLKKLPFSLIKGRNLVIEEKLDGSNSGISFSSDGDLFLQSRGHFLNGGYGERHFALLKQMANQNIDILFDVIGDRYVVYGEWLYARHAIYYNKLISYFMEFDVYDKENEVFLSTDRRNNLLEPLRGLLPAAPVLATTFGENKIELNTYEDLMSFVAPSAFIDLSSSLSDFTDECKYVKVRFGIEHERTDLTGMMEGLYIKVEEDGVVTGRYKCVRRDFTQMVVDSDSHWQSRIIVRNKKSIDV